TYIALFYPTHEYAQIRTAFALALGYAAVHFLLERKFAKGIIWLIVGVTFHYSAIMLGVVYVAAQYMRGRAAIAILVAGLVVVSLFSNEIVGAVTDVFSSYNPLLKYYISNSYFDNEVRLTSLNNLLPAAALALAIALGWFSYGKYHTTFLAMSIAGLVAIALLGGSPVVAQRLKELLFVAVIFLIYRSPIVLRNLPPIILIWANAALLLYLAFREGLLTI
ncbi:MAG: EpsG family protein, partial [Hyphomicrobiales bacterium]